MNKTVEGLFRQSFFSCPTISKFISLHFKYHRYFYSASENNKLESGEIRVNKAGESEVICLHGGSCLCRLAGHPSLLI